MAAPTAPIVLLTPRQVAERLGLAASTLAKQRCLTNTGPVFVKVGAAVRYPEHLLAEYIAALPLRRSTSDSAAAA